MRAEVRKQIDINFNISWECVHDEPQIFAFLCMSANDHESTETVDLGVTNFSE